MESEAGLARTRNAGDYRKLVPGNSDIDVFQVVLAGTVDLDIQRKFFAALERAVKMMVLAMLFRKHRCQVFTGLAFLVFGNLFRSAYGYNTPATHACLRP